MSGSVTAPGVQRLPDKKEPLALAGGGSMAFQRDWDTGDPGEVGFRIRVGAAKNAGNRRDHRRATEDRGRPALDRRRP